MPVKFNTNSKTPPEITHVDEDDLLGSSPPDDPRLHLDPRIKGFRIDIVSVDELKPNARNARKHPEQQISVLASNIEKIGFWSPIIADQENVIQAGHARWLAAQRIGLRELPVIRQNDLTPAQRRAFALADNKISELAEWDYEILGQEFEFLSSFDEVEFDFRIMGFSTDEIDQVLDPSAGDDKPDPLDDIVLPDTRVAPVTRPGDIWVCDKHILLCGDARNPAHYTTLLEGDLAQVVFTDPPYNVPNAGHVTKREGVREFDMAGGEMSRDEFTDFLQTIAQNISGHLNEGAVAYICMDWRHIIEMSTAGERVFGPLKNLITWVKPNAGMGSFYRSQHELIFVYCPAGRPVNNFGLGQNGRHRSNVWTYRGLSSFGRDRDETLAMHPTVKPVALVKDALKDCSHRGDLVLDPFGGSGTTMIAAEATKRRARLIEIDPLYCDTIVGRWEKFTGKSARLAETKETFTDVKLSRAASR